MFADLKMKFNPFAKIISGELECKKVLENEHVLAFYDIAPQAPVHILVIPKQEIVCIQECDTDSRILNEMFKAAQQIAKSLKIEDGYKCIFNNGTKGGQEVPHLHLHILGGW